MRFHPRVLDAAQRRVVARLGPFAKRRGLVLVGGTALALQLGHRKSVDLDWFGGELDDPSALAGELLAEGIPFRLPEPMRRTLHGEISGVRVSFIEFRYPWLSAPLACPGLRCEMASLDDLAAMKLSAISQRGSRKDFVDIHALLLKHAALENLLEFYRRKFSAESVRHILQGLAYFDDAENQPMPRMLWPVTWPQVKKHIRKCVLEVAR